MTRSGHLFLLVGAVAMMGLLTPVSGQWNDTACWKDTVDRGVGKPISYCNETAGWEKSGALCYPKCKEGYYGVACVCWEHCKPGYVVSGFSFRCHEIWKTSNGQPPCTVHSQDEGALCRKEGSIITYAKKSYGRGVGKPMGCPPGTEEDAALCYPLCPTGYKGVGPVCWEQCPTADPVNGGAICCRDSSVCNSRILDMSLGLPIAVAEAILSGGNATAIEKSVFQAIDSILGFVMPLCSKL